MTTNKLQITFALAAYATMRIFSYFFTPGQMINTVVSICILLLTVYWLIKKDERGWYMVAGEMILGGAGGFLAMGELSLRTCLLICSVLVFGAQKAKELKIKNFKDVWPVLVFGAVITLAAVRGYWFEHSLRLVFADTIPYLFFLYYFPLKQLVQSDRFKQLVFNLLIATIIGNLLFVLFTFTIYSAGYTTLHDSYYQYWRDVAGGKITDLQTGFWRVVLNEQLLLTPLLLYFTAKLLYDKKNRLDYACLAILIMALSTNLTRIYLLAWLVGLLVLFNRQYWKKWVFLTIATVVFLVISFSSIHLIASRGQSLGWELFGLRIGAVIKPASDPSALSRLLLLRPIWEKVKQHPILGNGLGQTITVYNPITKQTVTTPHFDWGYLEIWAEMGLLGLLLWLGYLSYLAHGLYGNLTVNRWPLSALVALALTNLTSPALFHVMGVTLLTILMTRKYNLV